MARPFRAGRNPFVLFLLLLSGALVGSAIESVLPPALSLLRSAASFGLQPSTLDLHFMQLTFGFIVTLGPLTALGLILGYIVWSRI
jgi:hypothetical protein